MIDARIQELKEIQKSVGFVNSNCYGTACYILGIIPELIAPHDGRRLVRINRPEMRAILRTGFDERNIPEKEFLIVFFADLQWNNKPSLLFHVGISLGGRRMFHQRKNNGRVGETTHDTYLKSLETDTEKYGPRTYRYAFYEYEG